MTNNPTHGVFIPETEGTLSESEKNWQRYFTFSTDHKVIGVQYLVTSFIF